MKKIIYILFAFILSCGIMQAQNLVIVHVNDTHSHNEPIRGGDQEGLGGAIEIAAHVDSVRAAAGKNNVLLLHAGDWSQGSSYFTKFGGEIEDKILNATGFDVLCLGNHEFDNGVDALAARLKKIKAPVVCSNYDFPSPLDKQVEKYVIVIKGNFRIGIYSILCDLGDMVDRRLTSGLTKLDDVETANEMAKFLKVEKKCDIVIALTHDGFREDCELVKHISNTDIVIGGHSHTELKGFEYVKNKNGKEIPIIQDGCWGLNVGRINVY